MGRLRRGLGQAGQLREGQILRLLGLERLTALGRVGAVRVEVGRLELDQAAFLAAHHDVTLSAYRGRLVVTLTGGGVSRWDGVVCGLLSHSLSYAVCSLWSTPFL